MTRAMTTARYHKILFGVLLIAFGLVALAVLYKAASLSTEGRSKAAQTEKVYYQWTFNKKKDALGWEGVGAALSAGNGRLKVIASSMGNKYMGYKFSEPLILPVGGKTVKINLSLQPLKDTPIPIGIQGEPAQQEAIPSYWDACVTAEGADRPEWCPPSLKSTPTPTCKARPSCLDNPPYCRIPVTDDMCPPNQKPTPKPKPRPATATYTFGLSYTTSTGTDNKAVPFVVSADGKKQLVSVQIPEIGEIKLTGLKIGFGDPPVNEQILIDEIRLVGAKGKEQACETPPKECMTYRSDGSVIICDPPPGVTYCKPSPTTYPTPTCISLPACIYYNPPCSINIPAPPPGSQYCPKPSPKPSPKPGCYYQDVVCVQAPCESILVCPTPKACPTPPACKGRLIVGDPRDTSQCPVYQCSGGGVVCTQEAKLCPNGVYVSRTGPNCEFAPCPVIAQ